MQKRKRIYAKLLKNYVSSGIRRIMMKDFKELINSEQYSFLHTNKRLGKRILLLGLGGSYAYGTNNECSMVK